MPMPPTPSGSAPRSTTLLSLWIALGLVVAACSGSGEATTTTGLAEDTTVAPPPPTTAEVATTLAFDGQSVVQEYLDRRSDGRIVESLELATLEVSETYTERQKGLAAWNFRSEQAGPCVEAPPGTFTCPMLEYTDFHTIAGISPWTNNTVVKVNDEGMIYEVLNRLVEWPEVRRFNEQFQEWLTSAHPEEAAKMTGPVMTLSFTEDDALIALQYVDQFVDSQSDG